MKFIIKQAGEKKEKKSKYQINMIINQYIVDTIYTLIDKERNKKEGILNTR